MSLILSGTTGVSDVDGTAATPALRGTDTNTGIFFPAADTIAFAEGGAEVARFDSSGNLGIGTSSPTAIVHASKSTASDTYFRATNSLVSSVFGTSASGETYVYNNGAYPIRFFTNDTERMRIDSSGNLGLGVTPPASGSRAIYTGFATSGILCMSMGASGGSYGVVGYNTGITNTSGAYNYMIADTASAIRFSSGGFHFLTAPSGTAGNAISFTQAMTLDASGNLLVGTTSSDGSRLRVYGAYQTFGDGSYEGLIGKASSLVSGGGSGDFAIRSAANLVFATSGNTERARIDSSGNLLVGTTSGTFSQIVSGNGYAFGVSNSTTNNNVLLLAGTSGSTAQNKIVFANGGSVVGTVYTTGSATSYNTSSDYRLKENIQPMTGALAKVQALKPCTYKWKADGSDGEGFIAHELAEVVPQCVTGEKDAVDADGKPVYQGIDTSFLVATLTAAIQELKAELDAVKTELAALKGTA